MGFWFSPFAFLRTVASACSNNWSVQVCLWYVYTCARTSMPACSSYMYFKKVTANFAQSLQAYSQREVNGLFFCITAKLFFFFLYYIFSPSLSLSLSPSLDAVTFKWYRQPSPYLALPRKVLYQQYIWINLQVFSLSFSKNKNQKNKLNWI